MVIELGHKLAKMVINKQKSIKTQYSMCPTSEGSKIVTIWVFVMVMVLMVI